MGNYIRKQKNRFSMSTVITICNPQIEDCASLAAYGERDDQWIDILSVALFMTFDFVMSFVPLILHYAWLPGVIASLTSQLNLWGVLLAWASSWVSWVGNLITYGPVLFWSIFAFFPGVF